MMPPMTLNVKQCFSFFFSLMTSMALEVLKQLTWNSFWFSLCKQKGQYPQVCNPVPLSMTCPRSLLKIVHLPSLSLNPSLNLSPSPQVQSESTSVPISRQQSLQTKLPSQVEKRTALLAFLVILKSNGFSVYSNLIAARLRGQLKFLRGSMGNTPSWGTQNRWFLASTILKSKSLKVQVCRVKISSLMIGLVGLMQYSSEPVQLSRRVTVEELVWVLVTLQLDFDVTAKIRQVASRICRIGFFIVQII